MSAIAAPVRSSLIQGTPAWVDGRRDFIGSSDISIITGNSPYATSLFGLWAIKTRLAEPEPIDPDTQELFDLGHALEPVIAKWYTGKTGRRLKRVNQMLVHHSIPWASASLDRVSAVKGERRIVEVKWVPNRHWIDTVERVPSYVQDQVQWQLMVYPAAEVADVAVLNGSRGEVHEIGPDDSYQDNLLYLAKWFRDMVTRGVKPPIDGSEATLRALRRLYPRDTLGMTEPTVELEALVRQERAAAAAADVAESEHKRIRGVLMSTLEEHSGVEGEDWRVTFRKNADSTKSVTAWDLVAKAYREDLQRLGAPVDCDAIEGLYTTTTVKEGARPLIVRVKSEERGTWS